MKDKREPIAHLLRPVLDTYRSSAVALVGCHSQGLERESCELDLVVVAEESLPPTTVRVGGVFVDLSFQSEKNTLKPAGPEQAVSMALARPIRDTSLVLSTGISSSAATARDSARRSSRARLAAALKALGRADQALAENSTVDADYWLHLASFDFGYAWLFSEEVLPAPSHLLDQLKQQSKGSSKLFEAFSGGTGLNRANRSSCAIMLEAILVLHDVLRGSNEGRRRRGSGWSSLHSELVKAKATELSQATELPECYCYLGQEAMASLAGITQRQGNEPRRRGDRATVISKLSAERKGLLSSRLIAELGMNRSRENLEEVLGLVRGQVSRLAGRA